MALNFVKPAVTIFMVARLWQVQAEIQETCMQQSLLQHALKLDPDPHPDWDKDGTPSHFDTFR